MTDTDQGWWGWMPQPLQNIIVPLGCACNLHFQIFSSKIYDRYQRIIPDIFKSFCTESTFPYINASVGLKWLILTERLVQHIHSMDGASSGFGGNMGWWDLLPGARNIQHIINDQEGTESGFGYEECGNIKHYNKEAYDENSNCKDPERLANFIAVNIFLPINYEEIGCQFE
jgi:hypothetical protein